MRVWWPCPLPAGKGGPEGCLTITGCEGVVIVLAAERDPHMVPWKRRLSEAQLAPAQPTTVQAGH